MRITGITSVLYEYPLTRPIGDVHIPAGVTHGVDAAITIHTDEPGVWGVTIGGFASATGVKQLEPLLLGEDPRAVKGLWQRMVDFSFKMGVSGPGKLAIAAVDCALWDLRARAHGVPLWKELGGDRRRVPVYASGLDTPLDAPDLVDFYRGMADKGVTAGKLKVGRDPDADERRLDLMAEALSGAVSPRLVIDANEYWSPKQAVQRIRALERRHTLTWVEEPVARLDYDGLRQVTRAVDAPLATGENLNLAQEYVPLLQKGAVDVVQIGCLTSGITGAMQVADLALSFNRPVAMSNCPGRYMAHLAAVLPHHTMMEVIDAGRDAVLVSPLPIRDGNIELDDRPGSGVEFDSELVDKHRVEHPMALSLATGYRRATDAGLL